MLVGDRSKFFGVIIGLAFAALLMTQQSAIFFGVMALTYGHATDTPQAEIWISDPGMMDFSISDVLNERELDNVRAIQGVSWAAPLLRRLVFSRDSQNAISPIMVLGIDDATCIGGPLPEAMVTGSAGDILRPNAVILDDYGSSRKLRTSDIDGKSRPVMIGDQVALNGHNFEVVGFCRSTLAIIPYPTAYMLRSRLSMLDRGVDGAFNFIIAGVDSQADPNEVCARIAAATGLAARTRKDFCQKIYDYYLYKTGLPANFAIAVILGFIVGAAIAGQTFSQFVNDNRRIFASLKAMGMRNSGLMRILFIQASFSAMLGLGLGVGGATIFGLLLKGTDLSFRLEPILLFISFAAVLLISLSAAMISLRSLLRLDPAIVFRS